MAKIIFTESEAISIIREVEKIPDRTVICIGNDEVFVLVFGLVLGAIVSSILLSLFGP